MAPVNPKILITAQVGPPKDTDRVGEPIHDQVIDETHLWPSYAAALAEIADLREQLAGRADDPVVADYPMQERCGCGYQPLHQPVQFHRRGSDECRAEGLCEHNRNRDTCGWCM